MALAPTGLQLFQHLQYAESKAPVGVVKKFGIFLAGFQHY